MPTTLNNEGVKFPDNSTQISAKTVIAEFPVASGKTAIAGKVLSITSDGNVGNYPVPNAITAQEQAISLENAVNIVDRFGDTYTDNTQISPQGTRALGIVVVQSGHTTNTHIAAFTGFAITANSITNAASAINLSASRGSPGWYGNNTLVWATETDAVVNLVHSTYQVANRNNRFRQINVSSNGTLTVSPEVGYDGNGNYYSQYTQLKKITNTVSMVGNRQGSNYFFRYVTINGTGSAPTLNGTVNDSIARPMIEGGVFRLTPSNILISFTGNQIRRATFTNATTVLSNYLQFSNFIPNVGSSEPSLQSFMSEDGLLYIALYRNTLSQMELRTYNVNTSTGEPTFAGSIILKEDASVFKYDNARIAFKTNLQFLITFLDAGLYYAQSVDLNTNGSIKGVNERQGVDPSRIDNRYNVASDKYWLFYRATNRNRTKHYTVNAYSTIPFNSVGIAAETKSSGVVKTIINGVASGFSGLVVGQKYYVDSNLFDGSITSTTGALLVGTAISTTELKLA
jgi:hypothetical protein